MISIPFWFEECVEQQTLASLTAAAEVSKSLIFCFTFNIYKYQIMSFLLLSSRRRLLSPIFTRLFSSSAPQIPDLRNPTFKVNDYLVSTFDFSAAKAATVSKRFTHLKSPRKPEAVRHFLEHHGFGEDEIKIIVTRCPDILCSSPEYTLGPNLVALRNMGLSSPTLTKIILAGPVALQLSSAVPRINFWKEFLGGEETLLITAFKRNRRLVGQDITGIATKITLLQSHGISTDVIRRIICVIREFITRSVSMIEDLLKRAKEFGFQPESGMFVRGLQAMWCVTREALQKKLELLKSYGWSEDEFLSAVRKSPAILHLSKDNLRVKMDFLLGEAKCDISYITFRPGLLTYSLKKRLRPRHHVLKLVESKGLSKKRKDLLAALKFNESMFVETYIVPHEDKIPELREVYQAACSSVFK